MIVLFPTNYAEMNFSPDHDYYFEQPNDHIPGMMLIETARLMLVACSHKYGNVPLKNYIFILSKIDVAFKSYVELEVLVFLKVNLKEHFTYSTGAWADVTFEVYIYQRHEECVKMNFTGNILHNRTFQRIRGSHKPRR